MNRSEFVKSYADIVQRALNFSEKARIKGLLAVEEELDHKKADERDIFEYGMRFVIDGIDYDIIEKILLNIIKQEKDENAYLLKSIQKEAVLMIQVGTHPRLIYALLNSYTDITISDDEIKSILEE
jgi:flagellar motor component MotA